MKRVQIQILFMMVLFGNAVPMCGMTAAQLRQLGRRKPTITPTTTVLSKGIKIPPTRPIVTQSQIDTSTWLGWLRSKLQTFQIQPVVSQVSSSAKTTTSPFALGGQKRGYSTIPVQRTTFWENVTTALFGPQQLTLEEFGEKLHFILRGRQIEEWTAPNGRIFNNKWMFDNADLDAAKKLIEENERFINAQMYDRMAYDFMSKRFSTYSSPYKNSTATVLDMIFMTIMKSDNYWSLNYFVLSDNVLNLIKLAEYVVSKGGVINPEKASSYKDAYLNILMPAYRKLCVGDSELYGVEYELDLIKKLFKWLDFVLEKLIPGFKKKLHEAQKERANIEQNLEAYQKQIKDKENRAKFVREKIEILEIQWRRSTGKWDDIDYPYPGWDAFNWNEPEKSSQWNENEYKEWLKYQESFKGSFRFNFNFGGGSEQTKAPQYQGKAIWDLLPGLTATSSKEAIKKAFFAYSQLNHPDKLPKDMPADKREAIEEEYRKVSGAWSAYTEGLKQQMAAE